MVTAATPDETDEAAPSSRSSHTDVTLIVLVLVGIVLRFCAALAGLVGFSAVWAAHSLAWSGRSSPYPSASPAWLSVVVNEIVAPEPSNRWLGLPMLVLGAVLIMRRPGGQRRVWVILGLLPLAAVYVLSLNEGILIPKSLMAISWAPAMAVGAVVGAAWNRSIPVGGLVALLVAFLVVPYTTRSVGADEGAGHMIHALEDRVEPGDAVLATDERDDILDLVHWYRFVVPGVSSAFDDETITDHRLVHAAGDEPSGRLGLVTSGAPEPVGGASPCGAPRVVGGSYFVQCLELSS